MVISLFKVFLREQWIGTIILGFLLDLWRFFSFGFNRIYSVFENLANHPRLLKMILQDLLKLKKISFGNVIRFSRACDIKGVLSRLS